MKLLNSLYCILFLPSHNSIFLCRQVLKAYKNKHKVISKLLRNKLLYKYGIHLGLSCSIGENLKFPHPNGIIIGEGVIIGKNCTVYHQVTLGKKSGNLDNKEDYPIIGDNVTIFAGAKIIGNVIIGDNSIIGANSVVLTDVEPNSLYVGIPAKKINKERNDGVSFSNQ